MCQTLLWKFGYNPCMGIKKSIFYIIISTYILFSGTILHAVTLSPSTTSLSLLEHSTFLVKDTLPNAPKPNMYHPCKSAYINTGITQKEIWITFSLENNTSTPIQKILLITSPLLEHIALYQDSYDRTPQFRGMLHLVNNHHTLFPYFPITIAPYTAHRYYMNIKSTFTPVDFALFIKDKDAFLKEDRHQQLVNILLIGFVLALAIYSLMLFFYIKDKSYLYYSLYLFALIYQQITYLGLTQIYFPLHFIMIDIQIPVLKVALLIITAALFAIHFLKIDKHDLLYRIYRFFIIASIIEVVLFSAPLFFNLDAIIFTGALFIVFNLTAGILSYRRGIRQARLFIVGFSIVFVSYALVILDAVGATSIMQHFQNILMFGTALEALILSLAFADRYIILQKEKSQIDARLLAESKNRAAIIKKEVEQKTKELNKALQTKEMLIQEIHHRVKNNLQIILSMIRLQDDATHNALLHEKLTELEHRINAISKTYTMLLETDDLEQVDMEDYLSSLLQDIADAYDFRQHDIDIKCDIHVYLPLKQAVYIGLIVNELVTNAYKHAFRHANGTIIVSLYKEGGYHILSVEDSGTEYAPESTHKGLGLKLLYTLVQDQLEGTLEVSTFPHTKYTIRFTL